MTEYVYKLKNGKIISAYADEKGNISITKEALEIMVNSWNDGYQKGRADAERDFQNSDYWNDYLAKVIKNAKADVIEEFGNWLFENGYDSSSHNIKAWITEYNLRDKVAEQLKDGE